MSERGGFHSDLEYGEQAQDRVFNALVRHGFCKKQDGRSRYDFEFIYQNHAHRVEVKNEDRYADSGNICVETVQGEPPKESGVAWSEATVVIHTLANRAALYRRREMHKHCRELYASSRANMKEFGDNKNKGFLVAVSTLGNMPWFDCLPTEDIAQSSLWNY